jgi:hypothetical protein
MKTPKQWTEERGKNGSGIFSCKTMLPTETAQSLGRSVSAVKSKLTLWALLLPGWEIRGAAVFLDGAEVTFRGRMRKYLWRFLDHTMPDGPPVFLVAIIRFLFAIILTIWLRY